MWKKKRHSVRRKNHVQSPTEKINRDKRKDWTLRESYGISLTQWYGMYEMQNGKCPICLKPIHRFDNTTGKRAAQVDHDHKTGRVRGLLCFVCNRIRVSNNTVDIAKRMVDYLSSDFDGRSL